MKTLTFTIVISLILALSVLGQTPRSDRERDKLIGLVKSVQTDIADLKTARGKLVEANRRSHEAIAYDKEGRRLTWKVYDFFSGELFDSVIYSLIDGNRVLKYEAVEKPNKITTISTNSDKPTKPFDTRYDYRLTFKYDSLGNVLEEAWHHNSGDLWLRYVYKFEGNYKEELVYDKEGSLNQKYRYILDAKGNEIEMVSFDTKTDRIESKEIYGYLKFDIRGNWTKRTTSSGNRESNFEMKPETVMYRTVTYF